MTKTSKKKTKETAGIEKLLREHFPDWPPQYPPEVYRYNPASIRIRLVNDRFRDLDRIQREEMILPILEKNLPEETWWDITIVLLLTPEELEDSFANREFEKPTPSRL
jgi:stress-induced morphogen